MCLGFFFMNPNRENIILGLKTKHKNLFLVKVLDYEFIFRPLTHNESINVSFSQLDPCSLNDYIFEQAVLWAEPGKEAALTSLPAGVVDSVVDCIVGCSQFGDEKAFDNGLKAAREEVKSIEGLIEMYICSVFKSLKPSDVKNMDFYEQMYHLAMAEAMIGQPITLQEDAPKKGRRSMDPNTRRMLSREVADKPDFEKDNRQLRELDR